MEAAEDKAMVVGVGGAVAAGYSSSSWGLGTRACDSCGAEAARLYCRADGAFLCARCDARAHGAGSRHARVWLCEVCEHAPAAVTCRADAAALCAACDADIHSANPLARRHERLPAIGVPVAPPELDLTAGSLFYPEHCMAHSLSSSEVAIVPDALSAGAAAPPMVVVVASKGKEREARLMRYREKRKNRRFDKTIRYASRKAYAETRPRIKGRFAKRTADADDDDEAPCSPAFSALAASDGVVPSF
uniref:Uncharacterized protein n=1 Tax=Oryza barthii TaxID=65489 RepID=A0A0D3F7H2_9ORYZ